MKLVGYVRVSSESQAENTSLGEQRKKLENYCTAMGHELIQIFEEVESGKNTKNRPVFQKALQTLDKADGLIACKLDRVARNTRDILALVEDVLQPKNKALLLLDLNVDTSNPMGKMILTIMAAVAALERDTINERTQGGRKAKLAKGGYAYGAPAYGQAAIEGELVANQDEQATIDLIRKHRRSGKSFANIAEYLTSEGIQSKHGNKWNPQSVKNICDRLKAI